MDTYFRSQTSGVLGFKLGMYVVLQFCNLVRLVHTSVNYSLNKSFGLFQTPQSRRMGRQSLWSAGGKRSETLQETGLTMGLTNRIPYPVATCTKSSRSILDPLNGGSPSSGPHSKCTRVQ